MRRPVAPVVAALVTVGLLGLGACGGDDRSDEDRLADRLEAEFDLSAEQAGCVAREVYGRFTADEVEAIGEAGAATDLPEDLLRRLRAVLTPCAGAGG